MILYHVYINSSRPFGHCAEFLLDSVYQKYLIPIVVCYKSADIAFNIHHVLTCVYCVYIRVHVHICTTTVYLHVCTCMYIMFMMHVQVHVHYTSIHQFLLVFKRTVYRNIVRYIIDVYRLTGQGDWVSGWPE